VVPLKPGGIYQWNAGTYSRFNFAIRSAFARTGATAGALVNDHHAGEIARAASGLPELNILKHSLMKSLAELGVDNDNR
jgi:hypothetical protein